MPRHQQPTADKVVDPPFIAVQRDLGRVHRRRDDRVVIGDIRIVHKPPAERAFARPLGNLRLIGTPDRLHHLRQRGGHVRRQMPAVRAGIAEELPGLVQVLREFERPLGTEPPKTVGVPLQLGKVVEQRGRHPPFLVRHGLDNPRAREFHTVNDGPRVLPVGRESLGLVGGGFAGLEPRARVGRGAERADNFDIRLGNELADLLFAFDEHCQRRRLHPADGKGLALRDRMRSRQIHSDQPIRLNTAAGCRRQ